MKKIVIWGAGNIGRSLVGQLFSTAGYDVVFVDVVDKIIDLLNEKKRYRIEVRDVHSKTLWVENVRAVNGKDVEKVSYEIVTADIMATAVGVENLRHIYANMTQGLNKRYKLNNSPIDIIICENVRNSSKIFREGLLQFLPKDYPLDSLVGLVETSIGKMVPIVPEEQTRNDPLVVFAESYNKIIADKKGFKNKIPKVKGLVIKENMVAYVDQKLFVHNMGHAVTAYLGYLTDPKMEYLWEAISNENICRAAKAAMWEAGKALILEYPNEFNEAKMKRYINDLIRRFNNKALGDTIYRVGRDLSRKLSRDDRLIGALLLETKHSIPTPFTTVGVAAATLFRKGNEEGKLYPRDEIFVKEIYPRGIDYILREICGLDFKKEKTIAGNIRRTYARIVKDPQNWVFIVYS